MVSFPSFCSFGIFKWSNNLITPTYSVLSSTCLHHFCLALLFSFYVPYLFLPCIFILFLCLAFFFSIIFIFGIAFLLSFYLIFSIIFILCLAFLFLFIYFMRHTYLLFCISCIFISFLAYLL